MMKIAILLVFGVSILRVCEGLRAGAPKSACGSMTPGHLNNGNASFPLSPQTDLSPYRVTADSTTYDRDGGVKVTVNGTASFTGVLLEARDGDTVVGEFSGFDDKMLQTLECSDTYPSGALTHITTSDWDEAGFEVTWKPGKTFNLTVIFYATVAQDHDKYWVGIESGEVTCGAAILNQALFMLLLPITVVISRLM